MGAFAAGIGSLLQLGGGLFGGQQANKRNNALRGLANTPGLDTTAITGQALAGQEANFGAGSALTDKINKFNQGQRQSLLDTSIPGYAGRKNQELNITDAMLRGEIPQDVQDQLMNSAAGRSLSGGYGGSGLARNLSARDFGLTSLGLMQQGIGNTSKINSDTANLELPDIAGVSQYLGLTPQQLVGLRGNERTQKLSMMASAINAPSGKDVFAKYLNDTGGQLAGAGLSTAGTSGFGSFSGLFGGNRGLNLSDSQWGSI